MACKGAPREESSPLLAGTTASRPSPYGTTRLDVKPQPAVPSRTHIPGWSVYPFSSKTLRQVVPWAGLKVLSVLVAAVVSVLDNLPYGVLILPPSLSEYTDCCVAQVLLSVAVAQAVFAFTSDFDCALGCNIVENTPFLKTMAAAISREILYSSETGIGTLPPADTSKSMGVNIEGGIDTGTGSGIGSVSDTTGGIIPSLESVVTAKDRAIATTLAAFMLSTLLVGLSFFLLAFFKLGEYAYCFPKQVLVGGIGGMGVYLVLAGIGVSCDVDAETIDATLLRELVLPENAVKWGVAVGLDVLLEILSRKLKSQFVTPVFLVLVPLLFPLALFALGVDYDMAQEQGWMFPKSSVSGQSVVNLWTAMRYDLVDWTVLLKQTTTIFGLVVFSVLHVPLNIPGLAMLTGKEADVNVEFMAHAVSNTVSGGVGCLQNYMVMSTSMLYYKVGGGGRVSSLAISGLILFFFLNASRVFALIPRCLGGLVCLHLGVDLMEQALVSTWKEFSTVEYATVVVIMVGMSFWGFTEGLIVGAVLAVVLYVRESSLQKRIELCNVEGLRSRKIRPVEEGEILEKHMPRAILMIKLNGELFFGNAKAFVDRTVLHGGLELLLIDCQLLTEIDCSGVDALKRVKSMAQNRHVKLVLAALQPRLIQKLRRVGVINVPRTDDLITCPTLNDALEYGEDLLVELSQGDARETEHDFVSKKTQECGEDSFEALREQMSQDRIALVEVPMPHPDVGKQSISFVQGLSIIASVQLEEVLQLQNHFKRSEVEAGRILWKRGQIPLQAVYLESGLLQVLGPRNEVVDYTRPGQLSGELGLCTGEKRRYTLVAFQPSVVLIITRAELQKVDPAILAVFQKLSLYFASHRLNSLAALGHVHSV